MARDRRTPRPVGAGNATMPPQAPRQSTPTDLTLATSNGLALRPKRTRLNVVQSKYGCFTCKIRKIKCDEERPVCLRCQRAQKLCLGYPPNRSERNQSADSLASNQQQKILTNVPIHIGSSRSGDNYHLARYTCQVLIESCFGEATWSRHLPQLCETNKSVMLSAAALGGAILAHAQNERFNQRCAGVQYSMALSELQKELELLPQGPSPLLISTVLLAGVELVNNCTINALNHVLGTYKLIELCKTTAIRGSTQDVVEDLDSMCYRLDLQAASFALGRMPDLPSLNLTSFDSSFEQRLHLELHSGYRFCYSLLNLKYRPSQVSPDILTQVGRRLGSLVEWLEGFKECNTDDKQTTCSVRSLTLRCQCLSLIIYLSSTLRPDETAYDVQAPYFKQIIQDAEVILNHPRSTRFTLEPGIIQPLYLTAVKYRDSTWRRKAIQLLVQSGREGPWNGLTVSRLAGRVVSIEEAGTQAYVAEAQRLHGISYRLNPVDLQRQSLIARFSRCRDLRAMLDNEDFEGPHHWEIWEEDLGII